MEFFDYWEIWVLPLVGGLIWYWINEKVVDAPGAALQARFTSLGTLKGRTYDEIRAVCGSASSISVVGDGIKLCQWIATSYHICLLFDENDICLGVSSETKV